MIPILSKQQNEDLAKFGSDLRALLERSVIAQERIAEASERSASYLAQINNRVEFAANEKKGAKK